MSANWPWDELGLDGASDERAIKRAYATRLKQIGRHDPDAFQRLRSALDQARRRATGPKKAPGRSRPSMTEIAGQPRQPSQFPSEPSADPDSQPPETPVSLKSPPKAAQDPEQTAPLQAPEPVVLQEPKAQTLTPPPEQPDAQDRDSDTAQLESQTETQEEHLAGLIQQMQTLLSQHHDPGWTSRERENQGQSAPLFEIFEQVGDLPGYLRLRFEIALARALIRNGNMHSARFSEALDTHFGWVQNATDSFARLRRVSGSEELILSTSAAYPKPKKANRGKFAKLMDGDASSLTLEEIASFGALLVAVLHGVMQAIASEGNIVFHLFVSSFLAFIGVIMGALLLELLWFILSPIRALGLEWALEKLWRHLMPIRIKNWFKRHPANKRGVTLALSGITIYYISLSTFIALLRS